MAMADITIYGAGIFGLSIAWTCAQRGARVQIIDPNGAGSGSSGGVVGALAPHTPENWNDKKQFQFESLIMAQSFWQSVEQAGGKSAGYARSGRLQPLSDARALDLARTRSENAKALWQGLAQLDIIDAADRGDWAPKSKMGLLVHDTLSGRMHPRMACAALVAALQSKGCRVMDQGTPQGIILEATGWQGLLQLATNMNEPVGNGVKGQGAVLDFTAAPDAPQLFADALHIIPHANGTIALGSTSEREFDDPYSTDTQLDDVIERAKTAFPILQDAPVIERWAGVRPRAKSRAPMIGHHPLRRGAFIANGGFKIGFGMAPKVAEVMADLILEGRDRIPEGFRPEASLR
ncbi:NAD(P)/FAD-dependent oxidoreductase [Planktotalea arctica]|uniref:NAD(P)/FAD-dependent oxidoreductase n=1 Tax=Planktotalea arctica TaxID=1481893 RepID=UPI003219097C